MAIINPPIFSAEDYIIIFSFENKATYQIKTALSLSQNNSVENEKIYAIGQRAPIANIKNAEDFKGSIEIQVGELVEMLLLAGVSTGIRINNATLAITAVSTNNVSTPFLRVYGNVNINGEKIDIKAKEKDSKASLDFEALTLN